jgi:hypothetical protein
LEAAQIAAVLHMLFERMHEALRLIRPVVRRPREVDHRA